MKIVYAQRAGGVLIRGRGWIKVFLAWCRCVRAEYFGSVYGVSLWTPLSGLLKGCEAVRPDPETFNYVAGHPVIA